MTKYVEMARHMQAHEGGSYILPDTMTRFLESDPDIQGLDVLNYPTNLLLWGDRYWRFSQNATPWGQNMAGFGIARSLPPASADQEVMLGLTDFVNLTGPDGQRFVAVRVTDIDNWYGMDELGLVIKCVAGVETTLGFCTYTGALTGAGRTQKIRIEGTTLKCKQWYAFEHLSGAVQPEPEDWGFEMVVADLAGPGNYFGAMYRNRGAVTTWFDGFEFLSVADAGDSCIYPRSLDARRRWASDGGENAVLLFELGMLAQTLASPPAPITGYAAVSTRPYVTEAGDFPALTTFEDIVDNVGEYSRRMGDQLSGKGEASHGNLTLINENGQLDHWNNYNWDGRPYTSWSGAQDWPFCDFTKVLRGFIADIDWSEANKLVVKMRDPVIYLMNARVSTDRYVQGSPPTLPEATVGRLIPFGLGRVFNATPELVDEANSEYQFNNGESTALLDVRESGNSVLGSLASTDLVNSKFRLGGTPAGPITCDFAAIQPVHLYDYAGSGSATIDVQPLGGIAGAVMALSGVGQENLELGATNRVSGAIGPPGGLFLSEASGGDRSVADILTEISTSHGAFWIPNREGRMTYGLFDLPASAPEFELEMDDFEMRSLMPVMRILPHQLERLYARKNYTIQNQIAFAVPADEAALYAAAGVMSDFTPTETGIDTPSNHILAKLMPAQLTLITGADTAAARANANTESERRWEMFRKTIIGFQFKTRRFANEFDVGKVVTVIADRWGLDDGKDGQVISVRENLKARNATVIWVTEIDGEFPQLDSSYPYLSAADFGL